MRLFWRSRVELTEQTAKSVKLLIEARKAMREFRLLVLGTLRFTVARFGVITAQLSSPTAEAIDRTKEANELRTNGKSSSSPKAIDFLELSSDLRRRIDNSSSDRLSLDALKEAAEIENLAHKLHQQMKD
jgi:hypothetical protein